MKINNFTTRFDFTKRFARTGRYCCALKKEFETDG